MVGVGYYLYKENQKNTEANYANGIGRAFTDLLKPAMPDDKKTGHADSLENLAASSLRNAKNRKKAVAKK